MQAGTSNSYFWLRHGKSCNTDKENINDQMHKFSSQVHSSAKFLQTMPKLTTSHLTYAEPSNSNFWLQYGKSHKTTKMKNQQQDTLNISMSTSQAKLIQAMPKNLAPPTLSKIQSVPFDSIFGQVLSNLMKQQKQKQQQLATINIFTPPPQAKLLQSTTKHPTCPFYQIKEGMNKASRAF